MRSAPASWGGLARAAAREESHRGQRLRPGDVVSAAVRNLREDPTTLRDDHRKYRPVVILGHVDAQARFLALGLTAQSRYRLTGEARCPLAGWARIPLHGPAFVFSWRPVFLPPEDVKTWLGRITRQDAELILSEVLDAGGFVDREGLLANAQAAVNSAGTT